MKKLQKLMILGLLLNLALVGSGSEEQDDQLRLKLTQEKFQERVNLY